MKVGISGALLIALIAVLGVDARHRDRAAENLCAGQGDGTFFADSSSELEFIVCYNEEPITQKCPEGSLFDATNLYCHPDEAGVCSVNGAFSPNPSNCSSFFVCYDQVNVEQYCGEGSFFNNKTLYCEPDTNHECWIEATTLSPCSCAGGYENGEVAPHPDSCYRYYVCNNGELSTYCCADGYFFNGGTKQCELDTKGECWPGTESTTETSSTQ